MTYAEVTHPLDEALANLAGEDKKVADTLASLDQPVDSGWFFASDLLNDEFTLEELLDETGRYWKTDWRFLQASLLLPYYIVPAVSAAIYGLYAGNRVLDVSARNFAVRLDESGQIADAAFTSRRFGVLESDPAAAHPDAVPLPDRASLVAWMFDRMIEHHLRPLFSHIRAQTKLGQNVMWAGAAYGCVAPLMGLQRAGFFTVEEALAEKTALLDNGPRQLRDRLTVYPLTSGEHQALFMRMEVCCQKHHHPDLGKCGFCALRPSEEQREMQQYYFDRHVAELELESSASSEPASAS